MRLFRHSHCQRTALLSKEEAMQPISHPLVSCCDGWEFIFQVNDAFLRGEGSSTADRDAADGSPAADRDAVAGSPTADRDAADEDCRILPVRLPHSVSRTPLKYADSSSYETVSGYRRRFTIIKRPGMRYILHFMGAAHIAEVFVNGCFVLRHACGYTEFQVDLTPYIRPDGTCLVAVRLDSTENPSIPPFGYVIDYLTYGGIYRPVRLEERPEAAVEDVFVYTPTLDSVHVEAQIAGLGPDDTFTCTAAILDAEGQEICAIHPLTAAERITVPACDTAAHRFVSDPSVTGPGLRLAADIQLPKKGIHYWMPDTPYLYTVRIVLDSSTSVECAAEIAVMHTSEIPAEQINEIPAEHINAGQYSTLPGQHSVAVRFGVRTAVFQADGFYLNGQKLFLRGLNRHQCYPYIGYAASASLQRLDAQILKNELRVNDVRTSHYPQSQDFIDACDELGLLVFTEIPGWQHIGDSSDWRSQVLDNTREMVLQYRNHPSIVLWGVRINESVDCDELYRETNRIAHELDPSRATSGVRYLENSSLLEDVYAFNDFSYAGERIYEAPSLKAPAAKPKRKVMKKHPDRPFIISECNGHMFPTKPSDSWLRREEQALRHARVLNDAMADGQHAGCFEWCMFDYPTHKDFGSGDRICYHGVMDAFRNHKISAAVWASQGDIDAGFAVQDTAGGAQIYAAGGAQTSADSGAQASAAGGAPVLEISSSMDIGDYDAGRLERCYAFTNADSVRLYKNGDFVIEVNASDYRALPHGPLCIDDRIGCLLQTKEGFTGRKEKLLHRALVAAGRYGIAALPLPDLLRMGWCMVRYGLTFEDGVRLYGKYVGNWGGEATVWRFDAIRDNAVVASVTRSPSARLHLEVRVNDQAASGTLNRACGLSGAAAQDRPVLPACGALQDNAYLLYESDTFDMALIRVRILDEYGSPAVYADMPVRFTISAESDTTLTVPFAAQADCRCHDIAPTQAAADSACSLYPAVFAGNETCGSTMTAPVQGGAAGTIIRTTGRAGHFTLDVEAEGMEMVSLQFQVVSAGM